MTEGGVYSWPAEQRKWEWLQRMDKKSGTSISTFLLGRPCPSPFNDVMAFHVLLISNGMESEEDYGDGADATAHERAAHKRQHTDCSANKEVGSLGPSLPPIYYSILKKKTARG
jgi:hypothetical protein